MAEMADFRRIAIVSTSIARVQTGWEAALARPMTSQATQGALAARLRELRLTGFDRPLNRKELGKLLGEQMRRPAGAYAPRRIADFESADAKSPPPPDVLRLGYAPLFGRATLPPYVDEPSAEELERTEALERELRGLRDGIGDSTQSTPPPRDHRLRRTFVLIAAAVVIVVTGLAAFTLGGRSEKTAESFCVNDGAVRPSAGTVAVVCARDVQLRPFAGAPSEQALGLLVSGDRFVVERYSSTGAWVQGTARLKDGREVQGWIQAGWFCPPAGTPSDATACAQTD